MAIGKRKEINSEERFRKRCKTGIHWTTAMNIRVKTFKEG